MQLQSDAQVTGSNHIRTANITLTNDDRIEFQSGDVVGYYHPPDARYQVRDSFTDGYVLYQFNGLSSAVSDSINLTKRNFILNFRQPLLQFDVGM